MEVGMSYRNILVQVDRSVSGRRRVEAAIALGHRFGCPVTGAFLASSRLPPFSFTDVAAPIPQEVVDSILRELVERASSASAAAHALFADAAGKSPNTRWADLSGDNSDALIACARRHDLTVLPPVISPAFGETDFAAADIGMASGGPVLILKQGGYPATFGASILIAWKESREAMRAIRDAWPFLEGAREIHFLRVGPREDGEIDAFMRQLLKDHGCVEPRLHVEENDEIPVGDLVRLHVGKTGADLVVMGLYGHSRMREFILGGVSRELLSDPPMPLLMSH
jgi:nucleotide-binding universal stress UspA family protein